MESKSNKSDCSSKCEENFRKCLSSMEHESVCRMQQVQCDCGCTLR